MLICKVVLSTVTNVFYIVSCLVRPYGLPVRTGRTASSLTTDYKLVLVGKDTSYRIKIKTIFILYCARLFDKTIFSVADAEQQADIIALGYEMTAGKRGSMSVKVNDESCMVCYMPVDGTTWSLAIVCPDSDVFRVLIVPIRVLQHLTSVKGAIWLVVMNSVGKLLFS
jgi:hypothetical protein